MKTSVLSLVILCLASCISAGCSDGFVNSVCPMMGGKVDKEDPSLVREWNGKKVGFCCPPCLEDWDELTDAEKAEKLANPTKDDGHTAEHVH